MTIVPKVSEVNVPASPDPQQDVDITSAAGWIWVFQQLAKVLPVRDLVFFSPR